MEEQETVVLRARLLASGVIRWWQFDKSKEIHEWLLAVGQEVAKIEDSQVVEKIRENLLLYGLRLPELRQKVSEANTRDGSEQKLDRHVEKSTGMYIRRANNQVSEYTEAHIRELLRGGMSKSAVARALRVNRRVVIRVARDTQSAQQDQNQDINDLGTISEGR